MGLENPLHLMIILMVVLLVFGAKRLPEMGRSLGSGMRGFKEAISGELTTDQPAVTDSAGGYGDHAGRDGFGPRDAERLSPPAAPQTSSSAGGADGRRGVRLGGTSRSMPAQHRP